jgi:hypothetical protein
MRLVSGRLALITQLPDAELTEAERAVAQDVRDVAEVWHYAEQLVGNVPLERAKQLTNPDVQFYDLGGLNAPVFDEAGRFDEQDYEELYETYEGYKSEAKRIPAIITCGRRAGKSAMGLVHTLHQNGVKHIKSVSMGTRVEVGTPRRFGKPLTEEMLEWVLGIHRRPAVLKPPELGHPLQNTFSNREVFKRWNDFLYEIGFHAPSGSDFTEFKPELVGPDGLPAWTGSLAGLRFPPLMNVIEENSIKDIKEIEDQEFEYHVERAALQSFPEKPQQVTSYSQFTDIFGKPDDGAKYRGIDWAQEATDREIFADMEAATKVPKEYLGTPVQVEDAIPAGVQVHEMKTPSRKLNTRFKAEEGKWIGSKQAATGEGRRPGRGGAARGAGDLHREVE